jgi:NDP-4-keto-2,6-dideoxyhexose 3-C-methyltransferase
LETVLDIGEQALTGVFPRAPDEPITRGPLRLAKCTETADGSTCGLVQLEHSYALGEMFGDNYGYRSGLNPSMVRHLHGKVDAIVASTDLDAGDLVIDIGSNDGTTLSRFPRHCRLVGIDPTAAKFRQHYPSHVEAIADFFSATLVGQRFPGRKAKVVTSFSMFYDLEEPLEFMRQIHAVLADGGRWVFEQSYLPTMLEMNSYDTVCHEHLEYYALRQIKWMADRVGFVIVDVTFNDVNGGSFSVTAMKAASGARQAASVDAVLRDELRLRLDTAAPLREFAGRVVESKRALRALVADLAARGEMLHGLGASTKGNVLLQYCELTPREVPTIGEVNPEKFGRFTPGCNIPIVAEDVLLASKATYLLILPWHFRNHFVGSPKFKGKRLVFPLPSVEIVEVA